MKWLSSFVKVTKAAKKQTAETLKNMLKPKYQNRPGCMGFAASEAGTTTADLLNLANLENIGTMASDSYLAQCVGLNPLKYWAIRIGSSIVLFIVFVAIFYYIMRSVAKSSDKKNEKEFRYTYENPLTLEENTNPKPLSCYVKKKGGTRICYHSTIDKEKSKWVKSDDGKTTTYKAVYKTVGEEVKNENQLQNFINKHLKTTTAGYVSGLVSAFICGLILASIIVSAVNFFWRWINKSKIMAPNAFVANAVIQSAL